MKKKAIDSKRSKYKRNQLETIQKIKSTSKENKEDENIEALDVEILCIK